MIEADKGTQRESFIDWVTFIEDRVNAWSASLPDDLKNALDYSPQSLKIIEAYALSKYDVDVVSDPSHKIEVDALISYWGETLRRNLPDCFWEIDIDNEDNIFFNLPTIVTPIGSDISPHYLMKRVLFKNKGGFLFDLYQKRLGFIQNPETY